jgi:hypothetical protein
MSFKKILVFAQNPSELGYDFIENRQFAVKTDETLYFLVVTDKDINTSATIILSVEILDPIT